MKAIGSFRGYRGFYEVRPSDGKVKGIGYVDGFKFEQVFTFDAHNEKEAIYAFRHAVSNIRYRFSNPYPDLTRNPFCDPTFRLTPMPKDSEF